MLLSVAHSLPESSALLPPTRVELSGSTLWLLLDTSPNREHVRQSLLLGLKSFTLGPEDSDTDSRVYPKSSCVEASSTVRAGSYLGVGGRAGGIGCPCIYIFHITANSSWLLPVCLLRTAFRISCAGCSARIFAAQGTQVMRTCCSGSTAPRLDCWQRRPPTGWRS